MMSRRLIAFAALAALMLGSLATTGGVAWYLRSDSYRENCAAKLSDRLGLPAEIGGVVPRSSRSREFCDVVVWLPEKRGKAHTVSSAVLTLAPEADDPAAYELFLRGGSSEISTRTWLRSDYRGIIESGLRPGFAPDGPRRVRFAQMNLSFERDRFRVDLRAAAGFVSFDSDTQGTATITCQEFNGAATDEPVVLTSRFSSHESGVRIDQLTLRVPEIPLAIAHLDGLASLEIRRGRFQGELRYGESDAGKRVAVSGTLRDVDLRECTAGLLARPIAGTCPELEVRNLELLNRAPVRASIRGRLKAVGLGDLLALIGLNGVGATATLDVGVGELSREGIDRLVASLQCDHLSLDALTTALGWGRMSGNARVEIDDLNVEQNRLRTLKARIVVDPDDGGEHWVEGELLRRLVSEALKFDLPPVLPERIEYTQLGVRLEVRDEQLYIFGTHGPRDSVILTAKLFGRSIPLIPEPSDAINLEPWLTKLREQARQKIADWPVGP